MSESLQQVVGMHLRTASPNQLVFSVQLVLQSGSCSSGIYEASMFVMNLSEH